METLIELDNLFSCILTNSRKKEETCFDNSFFVDTSQRTNIQLIEIQEGRWWKGASKGLCYSSNPSTQLQA